MPRSHQLTVSPQCGFASTEEGNLLTEEEQSAKLKLAVDVAGEVGEAGFFSLDAKHWPG